MLILVISFLSVLKASPLAGSVFLFEKLDWVDRGFYVVIIVKFAV